MPVGLDCSKVVITKIKLDKDRKALLERNPDPTEIEVRYWLAGNLCRCTGYDKLIQSVLVAAKEMRGA